eukprot:PhM_4_TR7965/c0_g1_i1/m.90463
MNSREEVAKENEMANIRRSTSAMQTEVDFLSKIMEKPVVGTTFSKFAGFYNPAHETTKRRTLEDDDKDDDLTKALEEDRRGADYTHRKKKDWMKSYMDESVKYAAVGKGK